MFGFDLDYDGNILFDNCMFEYNKINGSLFVNIFGNLKLLNTEFEENFALDNVSTFIDISQNNLSSLTIENCAFNNNSNVKQKVKCNTNSNILVNISNTDFDNDCGGKHNTFCLIWLDCNLRIDQLSFNYKYNNSLLFGHNVINNKSNISINLYLVDFEPKNVEPLIEFINYPNNIHDRSRVIFEPCIDTFEPMLYTPFVNNTIPTNISYEFKQRAEAFRQQLTCSQSENDCYMACIELLSCFGSQFVLHSVNISMIQCVGDTSCAESIIRISKSSHASILCKEANTCKGSRINIENVDEFVIECLSAYSCLEVILNITNTMNVTIICVQKNACQSIQIYNDKNNNINFYFYNFNENVFINLPNNINLNNLHCNPNDAYLSLQYETYHGSLQESIQLLFNGNVPCNDITFTFTDPNKISCYIQYSYNNLYPVYLKQFMQCYPPISISDIISNMQCYGTPQPTNHPSSEPTYIPTLYPTSNPTKSPTQKPTRNPTISNAYDSYIDIIYLMENYIHNEIVELIFKHPQSVFNNITLFIEESYVENKQTIVKYYNFQVIIQKVNNIQIKDVGNDKYGERMILWKTQNQIFMYSKIYCNELACNNLLTYDLTQFETDTQKKIQNYFNNNKNNTTNNANEIIFSVYSNNLTVKSLYPPSPWFDPVIIGLLSFIGLMLIISIISLLHKKQKMCKLPTSIIVDDAMWMVPMILALQISDFLTDLNLSIEMMITYKFQTSEGNEIFFLCTLGSIIFIIVPYILNLVMACSINRFVSNNELAASYYDHRIAIFVGIVCLTGSTFTALQVTSSAILGLNVLNSGLTDWEIKRLSKLKVFGTVFCENVPQLMIQLIYSNALGKLSPTVILSFTASSISVIFAMLSYIIQQQNGGDKRRDCRYKLEFKKQNEIVTSDEKELLFDNKGRTEAMSKMIAEIFETQHKNIQISKQCITTQYGLVLYVVHCLNETELLTDNGSDIIPQNVYVKKIYAQNAAEFNVKFKEHFHLQSNKYTVSISKSINTSIKSTEVELQPLSIDVKVDDERITSQAVINQTISGDSKKLQHLSELITETQANKYTTIHKEATDNPSEQSDSSSKVS